MGLRDWSGAAIAAIAAGWALVVTVLFWGPIVREVWRAKSEGTTVFLAVHAFAWILYLGLLIGPLALLTLAWWRARAAS